MKLSKIIFLLFYIISINQVNAQSNECCNNFFTLLETNDSLEVKEYFKKNKIPKSIINFIKLQEEGCFILRNPKRNTKPAYNNIFYKRELLFVAQINDYWILHYKLSRTSIQPRCYIFKLNDNNIDYCPIMIGFAPNLKAFLSNLEEGKYIPEYSYSSW